MNRLAGAVLVPALMTLAACSDGDGLPEPGKLKTYTGIYLHAYEVSYFMPSSVAEHWWIRDHHSLLRELRNVPVMETLGTPDARYVHLKVRGQVSELGNWGHMGASKRELVVSDILDISPATLEDFKRAECKLPYPAWAPESVREAASEACQQGS